MNIKLSKIRIPGFAEDVIFAGLLVAIFFFFDYNDIIFKPPQSTHMWRQADCLSFTENLAQGDCNFFHMQTHHLISDKNTTGAGVSEAPVLYGFIALLYKIFGNNYAVYRITVTILFFIGIFFLFKMLKLILKKDIAAFIIPIIIFGSPVIAFYASNFLTDTSAFALTLTGWYYFFKFKQNTRSKFLYLSFLFFTLAGLLKILSLTSFVALSIILVAELFTPLKFNNGKKLFKKNINTIIPFIAVILVTASWYIYAVYYNRIHGTQYFANRTEPVWNLTPEKIKTVLLHIKNLHLKEYYNPFFSGVIIITFILNMLRFKRSDLFLSSINLLLFFADLAIITIWFGAFKDHDYYFVNLMIFPVFNLINYFDNLKRKKYGKFKKARTKLALAVFAVILLADAKEKLDIRYNGWRNNDIKKYKTYYEIKPLLKKAGITEKDTIISIGDITNSYSLQALNMKGWTQMVGKNTSIEEIENCIRKGAKYIFVNDTNLLKEKYLKPFTGNKIITFKNITVFKPERNK